MNTTLQGLFIVALLSQTTGLNAQQARIQWDTSTATMAGAGCTKDADGFIMEHGNDVSIWLSNLGINLNSFRAQFNQRSTCTISLSARIPPGYYISQIAQKIEYGVTKTANTSARIAMSSSFFGQRTSPNTVDLPYGRPMDNPFAASSRVDRYSVRTHPTWVSYWCSPSRPTKGIFTYTIAVSGQKNSSADDLIIYLNDSSPIKLSSANYQLDRCQL